MNTKGSSDLPVKRVESQVSRETLDPVVLEEPLEIRVGIKSSHQSVSITMRTPSHDEELALGFLYSEGIINSKSDVLRVHRCAENVVRVDLANAPDLRKLERHFYTASSCGVCGKKALEALQVKLNHLLSDKGPCFNWAELEKRLHDSVIR